MKKNILHVGLDVDDRAFHGAGFDSEKQTSFEFKCKPTFGALSERIEILRIMVTKFDYVMRPLTLAMVFAEISGQAGFIAI